MSSYMKELKEPFKQGVSWSSVVAGGFIAIATGALLSMLTSSCTSTAMSPLLGLQNSWVTNLTSSVWMLLNFTIAFAIGGFFTGKIAQAKGAIHGFLMWSVTMVALMGLLGWTLLQTQSQCSMSDWRDLLNQQTYLKPDLIRLYQPPSFTRLRTELELIVRPDEALNRTHEADMERAKHKSKRSSLNPDQIRDALLSWCEKVTISQHATLKEQDRNALRNLLRTETEYSDQEIATLVKRINQIYEEEFAEMKTNQQAAGNEMKALNKEFHQHTYKSCWSGFLLMLFTAMASVMAAWRAVHPTLFSTEKKRLGE